MKIGETVYVVVAVRRGSVEHMEAHSNEDAACRAVDILRCEYCGPEDAAYYDPVKLNGQWPDGYPVHESEEMEVAA